MPLSRDTTYTQEMSGVLIGATLRAQQPDARRLPPGALWFAAATLAFLLSVAVGLWRLADPPRSAPPNVTPAILNPSIGAAPAEPVAPASAGARPQEDAASVLMPPVVYVFPTPTPSPHQPRVLDTLQLTEYTLPPVPTREAWTGPLPRPTATRALRGGPLPTPQGATQ